ncbi:MAG: carboxymuconolactone decarboxylase family protein [Acidiferrobacterales bacterium]|nr:carboxymuconolactone decarboxylase family protein [Pseudomonadota bacterium]TDJ72114.1 MAG: 4-carboxymuconolactone decarboxylase [Pseudomonadota bacterium]
MSSETFETGRKIRTEVLGEERVSKVLDQADDFNRDFQHFVTEYCWGAGWGRSALDRKQRSLLNLGMLAALNRGPEFELHFRGALKNGLTLDELQDALIQIAIYCGIPAGVEAFKIANKVRKEL